MHQAWVQSFSTGGGNIGRMITITTFIAGFSAGSGGAVGWLNSVAAMQTTTDGVGAGNQSFGTGGATHNTSGDSPFLGSDSWQFGAYVSSGVFVNDRDSVGGVSTFVKASAISNATGGTNISAYTGLGGAMTGFGTYFIVETYVSRSGAWTKAFWYVRRSGAWTAPPIYIRRSGAWTQVGQLVRRNELDDKREQPAIIVWPDGRQERALMRWDYDRPRYLGVGYPGWKKGDTGIYVPEGPVIDQRERKIILPYAA